MAYYLVLYNEFGVALECCLQNTSDLFISCTQWYWFSVTVLCTKYLQYFLLYILYFMTAHSVVSLIKLRSKECVTYVCWQACKMDNCCHLYATELLL